MTGRLAELQAQNNGLLKQLDQDVALRARFSHCGLLKPRLWAFRETLSCLVTAVALRRRG